MTEPARTLPTPRASDTPPGARLARLAAHPAFISLLLAAVTAAVFYPVAWHGFVSYDDPAYVASNPHVQHGLTPDAVLWAFRTGHACNWHPLTWLSHMLDYELYGRNAGGHHLTNLLFHILNTVLLFLLLRRLTGAHWRSAFVAALFALHPLHVESVAWIAERKDVLSGFFFMLTLWAYARYVEESKTQRPRSMIRYGLALACFALGLMSKPMLVTLPFVLLLLDHWPLGRLSLLPPRQSAAPLGRLLLEKVPFFLLAAVDGVLTLSAQRAAMAPTAGLSISQRLAHALLSYLHYLQALIVPRRMAVFYPYGMSPPIAEVVFASIVLALVTTLVLRSPQRYLPMGWFWFLGMLVPVIGLVQVGDQAWADRYTYLPSIGLFILLAWGAGAAVNRWRLPKVVWGIAAAAVLLSCAARTRDQLATWRNSLALFHHAIAVIPNNWLAWFNLGVAMERQGQPDEALVAYRKTLDLQPNHMDTLINIGAIFTDRKQFAEAVLYFERAVSARPGSVICHDNLAHSLMELGKFEAALPHLRLVVQQQPKNLVALDALSQTLARTGQFDEAVVTMQKARDLAQAAGQTKLAEKAQQLIELYRSHRSN